MKCNSENGPTKWLPGAAFEILNENVSLLDPEEQIFSAMLQGWERQQKSRNLNPSTILSRLKVLKRFHEFTDAFPWRWEAGHIVDFSVELTGKQVATSTLRNYQNAIALFLDYVSDSRYGWIKTCEHYFNCVPQQICDEWNTVQHLDEYEGKPERRPFTYDELDQLFTFLEDRHLRLISTGRKGSLAAAREVAMIKVTYAFGLRRQEVCRLDLSDFRPVRQLEDYGSYASVHVRYGKAKRGGPPRRRLVMTVPEVSWVVEVLKQYLAEIRPRFRVGSHPAVFPTERAGYIDPKALDRRFCEIVKDAGLPSDLTFHNLRHTNATHLAEYGYDPLFVQQQLGHSYASTTAIYTHVSSDFKNHQLQAALKRMYEIKDNHHD